MGQKSWGIPDELDGLSAEERSLIQFYKVPGMTMVQIAKEMGRSDRSIANKLLELRRRLAGTEDALPDKIQKRDKVVGLKIEE